MKNKLECEVVRDLLPSYVDKLTSDTTNSAVREHLAQCEDCTKALEAMSEPEHTSGDTGAQVDYLKAVRRRTKSAALLCGIAMMLVGMLLLSVRYFYFGTKASAADINYNITVTGNTVYFCGDLTGSALGVSRVVFEQTGKTVNVTVYTALKTFFNSGSIDATYEADERVDSVRYDDLFLWENGTQISRTAAQLYAATNPYVGDMPSNNNIASILGVSEQLGPYTSELQTEQEPYGWTLIFETPIYADDESSARDIMLANSYVMLAAIGNLNVVTWEYDVQTDTDTSEQTLTVTSKDATDFAGRDIKQCAQSPSSLQLLVQSLSTKWSGVRELLQESGTFTLNVCNAGDSDIYSMSMNYYLNGELVGTRGVENAGGKAFDKGESIEISFEPSDFPEGTSAIDLGSFSFDLKVTDKDGIETTVCTGRKLSAKYAWTFFYTLTGSFDGGFVINEG